MIVERSNKGDLLIGVSAGSVAHIVSGAVFICLLLLHIEGCDVSDGSFAALFFAVVADLLLCICAAVFVLTKRKRGRWRAFAGILISLLPQFILIVIALTYINRLPSGCPA